jgi:hypothetical protein
MLASLAIGAHALAACALDNRLVVLEVVAALALVPSLADLEVRPTARMPGGVQVPDIMPCDRLVTFEACHGVRRLLRLSQFFLPLSLQLFWTRPDQKGFSIHPPV